MLKKDKTKEEWFSSTPDIAKLKTFWIESSKSNLPLLIVGDSGVGKSFWIKESLQIRNLDLTKVTRIDYSLKKELALDTIGLLKINQSTVVWWENLHLAEQSELRLWINWWKEEKYYKDSKLLLYWEISSAALESLESNQDYLELYQLLKSFKFSLSNLEKRHSDIIIFIQHFLENANQDLKKHILSFDENFYQFFLKRKFERNLNELKEMIYATVAFTKGKHVKFHSLPSHFFENDESHLKIVTGISFAVYEKAIIKANLKYMNGNRVKTANILGISERNLYRKIKEYQLAVDK